MNKKIYIIYFISATFTLTACDQINNKEKKAVSETAIESTNKTNEIIEKSNLHFNQALSYISSAQASDKRETKNKLLGNAEIELNKALEINPSFIEALLNRGVIYMNLGQFNKAEIDLKNGLNINSKNPEINYNLACLYSLTNKLDLAADYLDQALENGFNQIDSLRNDPDISQLRNTKEFRKILDKHKIFIK